MVATLEFINLVSATWPSKFRPSFRIISTLSIGIVVVAFSAPAFALPPSTTSFGTLALVCSLGTDMSTLRAVASVESHPNPFTVRDNTPRESWTPYFVDAAASIAKDRLSKGHSGDVELMQANSANFAAVRTTVDNTGKLLTGISNGYANQVVAAQSPFLTNPPAPQGAMKPSPQWNVWRTAGVQTASRLATANDSSEIERAGAQPTTVRVEERTAVPHLAKGEPYEVFPYQEVESNRP